MEESGGYVLAFDFGLANIGVAVGQGLTNTARGIATVSARDGVPDWRAIKDLVEQYQPQTLIVGLPLNMDGSASPMSQAAQQFASRLTDRFGLACHMQDERLTSRVAREELEDARAAGRARTDHELAACLIAESWLQSAAGR